MIDAPFGLDEYIKILRAKLDAAEALAREMEAREKNDSIIDALDLYEGAPTTCAVALADDLADYAARAWPRERSLSSLPESAPSKRRAWHRVLRSRDGEALGWRRIYDIWRICNREPFQLQNLPCDSFDEGES